MHSCRRVPRPSSRSFDSAPLIRALALSSSTARPTFGLRRDFDTGLTECGTARTATPSLGSPSDARPTTLRARRRRGRERRPPHPRVNPVKRGFDDCSSLNDTVQSAAQSLPCPYFLAHAISAYLILTSNTICARTRPGLLQRSTQRMRPSRPLVLLRAVDLVRETGVAAIGGPCALLRHTAGYLASRVATLGRAYLKRVFHFPGCVFPPRRCNPTAPRTFSVHRRRAHGRSTRFPHFGASYHQTCPR
ncbi:hypothetical protein C8R46DRAFT_438129 [Mycena filopes]|nr:hypothetical protein C8R46DRAFT_438129 [Mycena filopes]